MDKTKTEFERLMDDYGYLPIDERGRTLRDYWLAPSGLSFDPDMNADWEDKPHRVLYDLIHSYAELMKANG